VTAHDAEYWFLENWVLAALFFVILSFAYLSFGPAFFASVPSTSCIAFLQGKILTQHLLKPWHNLLALRFSEWELDKQANLIEET